MAFHTHVTRNSQDMNAWTRVECVDALANLENGRFPPFYRKTQRSPRTSDKLELKSLSEKIFILRSSVYTDTRSLEKEGAGIAFLKYAILQWERVIKRPATVVFLGIWGERHEG